MLQRPSKYEAGPQKCCQELANKIEGNWGCYLGTQHCPPPPLWCGGGVALSPSPPCGVVGVWYGMLGMYGVYGRSGMACLESMVCLVCMVGMVCMA